MKSNYLILFSICIISFIGYSNGKLLEKLAAKVVVPLAAAAAGGATLGVAYGLLVKEKQHEGHGEHVTHIYNYGHEGHHKDNVKIIHLGGHGQHYASQFVELFHPMHHHHHGHQGKVIHHYVKSHHHKQHHHGDHEHSINDLDHY